ncbi:MAG: helix-turn-helix domain-containing protein [Nitrospirales bacterium]
MNGPLNSIPSLDSLAADLSQVESLPPEVAQALWLDLCYLEKALVMRALKGSDAPPAGPPERFLTVTEVSAQYGVTEKWLYRHKAQMPHSQPSRKILLFPEERLRKWFASRTGA